MSASADRDFVTLLWTEGDRANKLFTRNAKGKVDKAAAVERGIYLAQTVRVPDAAAMAALLRKVGADEKMCISLGYFPDAPEGMFRVWPRKTIAKALKLNPGAMSAKELKAKTKGWHTINGDRVIARTKDNMQFGSWLLGDRDLTPDMPPGLADMDFPDWDAAMDQVFPGWGAAALVMVPSSSSRVRVDGKPYGTKPSWHAFVQVTDPDDMRDRVWAQALQKCFALTLADGTPLAYRRHKYSKTEPGRVVASQPWALYDPTTYWPERLVFDGAPSLAGAGLSLATPDVRVVRKGGRVDPGDFADVSTEQAKPARAAGVRVERRYGRNVGISVLFVTAATLRLDMEFDGEDGPKSIRQLWLENAGHVRGQSLFRESTSEAAFFNQHTSDGSPFVYDTGADTKYVLAPEDAAGPDPAAFVEAIKAWLAAIGGKVDGPEQIKQASERARNAITAAYRHGWEQSAIDVLTEQLADRFAKPCGMPKRQMAAGFRKDAKGAAKAMRRSSAEADAGDTDALIAEMNDQYAVVMLGGSAKVAKVDEYDPCLDRRFIRIMGIPDFTVMHMNVMVPAPTRKDPDRVLSKGTWWLQHPERRQHLGGITLDASGKLGPEYLNTWRGFAVDPCDGDPGVFLEHIREITAGNGEDAAAYLTGWLATKVQNPGEQMEVAVILRGDEGTGKGAIGHAMRRIFGGHGLHVAQGEHLVGKFNSHLMDCCFLFADEAFFAGDPRHVNVLKALITESTITIEKKFVDAHQGRNRLGVMMASNSDFVVPAGKDARRFFCVNVPDRRKGDRPYFKRYWDAVADPAQLGAFLRHLLDYDLSRFEVRDFPQTAMLTDQKVATLDPSERWLLNRLGIGHFPDAGFEVETDGSGKIISGAWKWHTWVSTHHLFHDYEHTMQTKALGRFALDVARFGTFLRRYYRCERPRRNGRIPGYQLGDLDEARDAFAAYHGLDGLDWGEGELVDEPARRAS